MVSRWRYPEERIVAFVDIGTNSLRLLLVRITPNHSYTVLSDQKETVRLGEGEFVDHFLQPRAMERAALVARKFAEMARAYNAVEIKAVATAATREAGNRDEFIRLLKREAQLEVRVISGREEARLIYLGVSSGVHLSTKQALFIDIGGGSTEVIIGGQDQYTYLDSLKLGAIRLTSLFFLPGESGPVPPARYALIQQYVRNAAVRTVQQMHDQKVDLAIGSSGTIENLADISALKFQGRRRQRDDVLTYEQLQEVVAWLISLPLDERRKVRGINPDRADIIIGGAAILDTMMQELEIKEIRVTDRGLRDGLLVDHLARVEHSDLITETSVRARSVLQLGRACGIDEKHARHVANLALSLYDSARIIGLHHFGEKERELLEYSALIHDVGAFLSYTNHQQHSYYLVRNADLLGFDQGEIAIMANAARFHRKAMPRKGKHPEFADLSNQSQKIVRLFALLLRMAESLDRSHSGIIKGAKFRAGEGKDIILEVRTDQDCQLELWGIQNHRQAFKKATKHTLVLEVAAPKGG